MISTLILSVIILYNLFLVAIVLKRRSRKRGHVYFSAIILSATLWSVTILVTDLLSQKDQIIIWSRLSFTSTVFVVFNVLFFSIYFPRKYPINKYYKYFIIILCILFFALTFTKYIVYDFQNNKTVFKWGQPAFLLFMLLGFGYSLGLLLRKYKINRNNNEKQQIKYVLFGLTISIFLAIITNLIFPLFKIAEVRYLGPLAIIIFLTSTTYAIIKHRLLDIRLVIIRTITYSLVVLLISATVVGLTLLIPQTFAFDTTTRTILAIAVSVFIVLILDPLKKSIAKATDKLFFKAKVDYQKLLQELSEIINREIDLDVLLHSLSHKLEQQLKIKNASIYIVGVAGGAFYKRKGRVNELGQKLDQEELEKLELESDQDLDSKLAHNNPLIEYLRKEQRVIVLEALERKIEDTQDEHARNELERSKAELDRLDAAVVAPIVVAKNLNAVMVLGPKLSGDPFGSEDLQLLSLLGPQLASALDKSRLYDEIKQFSERLKKEIAIATEDVRRTNMQLQEQNRFLTAMQNVTNLITRTLDFKKVTQSIADSIYTELGYLGGILLFLGKNKHKLFPDAVTINEATEEILKLLPKPFTEYYGDFLKDNTRSIKAIKLGEVQIGTNLAGFISPPVPAEVSAAIQAKLKVKTVVAVPIYSEEEIVGVIDFLLKREPQTIKETDISIMKALCNQTGIVYRNIQLYKQLQDSNKDLAEANKHLQQLDQAKSEFVSIASHQLRTPMAGIMGYLSMILQNDFGKVGKEQKGVLEKLLQASQRMIQLINLFLDVSKIESGKLVLEKRPIQIIDVIDRSIDVLQKMADEKGLKLAFIKPKKPLPQIMADEKLFDVISNLIDNSIKYTEKGSITVKAENDGKNVKVSVQDTGRGILPEEAKELFTKFVRGSGMAQINPDGSGLGLYVARRITEAHGGKIWVESKGIGKGSTFTFTLPIEKTIAPVR